jgi:hypothetical protein|tara:strand:+ start:30 stop:527 length:498 start_codon:yes stop_codon:yes gene_type:complete
MAYKNSERKAIADKVCALMQTGIPCGKACAKVGIPKTTFLGWTKGTGGIPDQYAHAQEAMIHSIAEQIMAISDETPVTIVDQNGISRYDSAAVQHQRLQVDSRKWLLSKMMPKVYGDKNVQEITGPNGGPITLAALDLKNLSDEELESMDYLIGKSTDIDGTVIE